MSSEQTIRQDGAATPRRSLGARLARRLAPRSIDVGVLGRLLREYWGRFAHLYIAATVLMFIVGGTTALSAWMMRDVVNQIFVAGNAGMIGALAGTIVAIFFIRGFAGYGQELILASVGNRIVADVQRRLFDSYLKQDLNFFQGNNSSELVTRITYNAQSARAALQTITQSIGRDFVTLVGLIAVMFSQDAVLAGLMLLAAPILMLGISILMRQVRKLFAKEVVSMAEIVSTVQEASQGARIIKAFRLEDAMKGRMDAAVRSVEKLMNRMVRVQAATAPLVDIVGGLAVAGVIAYGGWRIATAGATPGEFFAFITALLMSSDPLRKLSRVNVSLTAASVGVKMMYDVIDRAPAITDAPNAKPLALKDGGVALKQVTFGYNEAAPVLQDVTLTAPGGKTTALVGLSGGGKSTIFNLVLRFWSPQSGTVEIDGQNVANVTAESLYESVSLVSQDVFLFGGSVRDNILSGRPGATEADIIEAAKAAAAHDFILSLPQGYDTYVGEAGSQLSGGQRQRISIARAFLKDASILLLDEPTSALDAESDAAIQLALARLMNGRTTLIIAHRLATIANADVIHIIDHGRVVESGTHAQLLNKEGVYARLHAMQFAS